jgi:hypothetical protein
MDGAGPRDLNTDQTLEALAKLFATPSHDRQVYCVFGSYAALRPFQTRLYKAIERHEFDDEQGKVRSISLSRAIYAHLQSTGTYDKAKELAEGKRDDQLKKMLSSAFREIITNAIEERGISGLVVSDFELFYAYDLGGNDISLVRQVAINGKKVCLLVPGRMHNRALWIFDEDPESREEFPDALLFTSAGWVLELRE